MALLKTLQNFFEHQAPLGAGDLIVVGFSGGLDSTALVWGLTELSRPLGWRVQAVHLDHGLDAGSAQRAQDAAALASRLGVAFSSHRCPVARARAPGESLEAAARRLRYRFLELERQRLGARYVATAHHSDDQAETVLLRTLFGSGVEGLAGIRGRWCNLVRPLLAVRRRTLVEVVGELGVEPVEDPTNRDLDVPRNRVRHRLVPALERHDPDLPERLSRLAGIARGANARIAGTLEGRLGLTVTPEGVAIDRAAFETLPDPLKGHALALLHRRARAGYPPSTAARAELLRQLSRASRVGCDCGSHWRWEAASDSLILRRRRATVPFFTYTLQIPGEQEIEELSLLFRVSRRAVAPWMFRRCSERAGMALPIGEGGVVTIRNRRPGDRIQPLGSSQPRRLKGVLMHHRVPRHRRSALPLLCVEDAICWVPGVAIDERFRLDGHSQAWVAEVIRLSSESEPPPAGLGF